MHRDQGTPLREKSEAELQQDLERLKASAPHQYARESARILKELEGRAQRRQRYAIT